MNDAVVDLAWYSLVRRLRICGVPPPLLAKQRPVTR